MPENKRQYFQFIAAKEPACRCLIGNMVVGFQTTERGEAAARKPPLWRDEEAVSHQLPYRELSRYELASKPAWKIRMNSLNHEAISAIHALKSWRNQQEEP